MKTKKTEIRFFSIPEWKKEEEYLREKHKMGWKFVRVAYPGIYYFEKCTPEDVVYQLDYNQEGIEGKGEYVQMFRDCGWEYLMDYAGYSYFRKPVAEMKQEEEIFCDNESRLEMIRRVFRGRIIPLIVIFTGIILPQLIMQSNIKGSLSVMLLCFFVTLFVLYLGLFIKFGYQYWKLKRAMK